MNMSGRFTKIPENQKVNPDNKIVVGFVGALKPEDLKEININYIKGFYNAIGKSHKFIKDYPVKINQRFYNGFMVIE